jgi:protein-L-isoaspartate O-methyltransferase
MFSAGKFSSNEDLVNSLQAKGLLKTDTIIAAFRGVDRGAFFPSDLVQGDLEVYEDRPLKIGLVHQSAPHMCASLPQTLTHSRAHACPIRYAHILELLQVQPGQRVLNIGSGTGYLRSPFI